MSPVQDSIASRRWQGVAVGCKVFRKILVGYGQQCDEGKVVGYGI